MDFIILTSFFKVGLVILAAFIHHTIALIKKLEFIRRRQIKRAISEALMPFFNILMTIKIILTI
jgi:hypothetical protein